MPAEQASINDSASKPDGVPGIKIAPIVPARSFDFDPPQLNARLK